MPNRYRFQGHELQDELGLNTYSTFYQEYDPSIDRCMQIDPKISDSETLYSGMANNPMLLIGILGDTTNNYDQEAGLDVPRNRKLTNYRGAQTMEDVITSPKQYSSLNANDPNKPFYDNPYGQARKGSLNFKAWTKSVSVAIKVGSGKSGITQGAVHYYSPRSMGGRKPAWHTNDFKVVSIPGARSTHITVIKKK